MKKAIYLEASDIKKLIMKEFGVPEKNIQKNQYSYTVIIEEDKEEEHETH